MQTFVESGTYLGDMVSALSREFKKIFSIELFWPLYFKAYLRFKYMRHIKIYNGDSGKKLKEILKDLDRPSLFWLDAHYSVEGTGQGKIDSPIINEIKTIFKSRQKNVILIDDANDFNGKKGYPKIEYFKTFIKKNKLKYNIYKNKNIIILEPLNNEAN